MIRVHEIIPFVKDDRQRQKIVQSVKFDMGMLEDAHALSVISTKSFFDIPFPVCLFQIDQGEGTVQMFLAEKKDEGVMWQAYALYPGGFARATVMTFLYTDGRGCAMGKLSDDADSFDGLASWEDLDQDETDIVKTMHTMAATVEVFSCCNVGTNEHEPPKFINAKRIAKGKIPFFSYRTLHLTHEADGVGHNSTGNSHLSPRLHLRRGHIRRLGDRRIWVRSSLVGDKSKGIAAKDYKVTRKIREIVEG